MNVKECAAWLNAQDSVLLLTHLRPDGDTLGSAAALCSALRRLGKKAALFNNPEITEKYTGYVAPYIENEFEYSCTVAVDIAGVEMFPIGFEGRAELCIDHHPTNTRYADRLLLGENKASCGEVVLEVIMELCGDITPTEASLLYIAVSTDCGGFRYANVTSETFAAASLLAEKGAETQKLNFALFRQMSRARISLEGQMCAGLRFYHGDGLAVALVTVKMMEDCGATENDCDDIAGIPGRVEGCRVSVLVRELEEGRCKVSLRSQPDFDCAAVCRRFGGGGHKMAAGCTIYDTPENVIEKVVSAINEVWE